jgi:hypothetical protein
MFVMICFMEHDLRSSIRTRWNRGNFITWLREEQEVALILQSMICSTLFKVDVEVVRLMSLLHIGDPARAPPSWHRQCFN